MTSDTHPLSVTIGVLALQGAFNEHIQLLRQAAQILESQPTPPVRWTLKEVRNETELRSCDALVIPGGESTAISLVAQRCNMLEPLRDFVKVLRKPTWGTCAGLILLAESANRTKKGGQELIGGLDVRVNRNHFGRQIESFQANLDLPFLRQKDGDETPFRAIFIRAPIVEKILPRAPGIQESEASADDTVVAPSRDVDLGLVKEFSLGDVEVMAKLPGKDGKEGDIIAVRQANAFGTSFHPELTGDPRIHVWWLEFVLESLRRTKVL